MAARSEPTPKPSSTQSLPSGVVAALLLAILGLAAVLRAYHLGTKEVWLDEANTVVIADRPVADVLARLAADSSPPLYYLLLHVWSTALGYSETALRSLSAIFGVLLVAMVFEVGRRLFSTRIGLLAALLVAISPVQILYSQEIRMYSLLPLLALGAVAFTCRLGRGGGVGDAIGVAVFTSMAIYTHNWALFLLPALVVVLLFSGALRARRRTLLILAAAIALAYLPWVPVFLQQLRNSGQYAWLVPFWEKLGPLRMLRETGTSFAFAQGGTAHLGTPRSGLQDWVAVAAWVLVALALLNRTLDADRKSHVRSFLACLAIPLAAAIGASLVLTPCYVAGRCDQLVFPVFAILLAVGIDAIGSRWARAGLVSVLAISAGVTLSTFYRTDPKAGDRAYSMAVIEATKPGEIVICTSLTRASLEYYSRRTAKPLTMISYPRDTELHLGNQDNRDLRLNNKDKLVAEADAVIEEAKRLGGEGASFLLVASTTAVNRELRAKLEDLVETGELTLVGTIGDFKQALVREPVRVMRFQFPTAKPTSSGG